MSDSLRVSVMNELKEIGCQKLGTFTRVYPDNPDATTSGAFEIRFEQLEDDEVDYYKGSSVVFPGDVWKLPQIAQSNGRAGRGQNEPEPRSPASTRHRHFILRILFPSPSKGGLPTEALAKTGREGVKKLLILNNIRATLPRSKAKNHYSILLEKMVWALSEDVMQINL